jgi:hypothetical protein
VIANDVMSLCTNTNLKTSDSMTQCCCAYRLGLRLRSRLRLRSVVGRETAGRDIIGLSGRWCTGAVLGIMMMRGAVLAAVTDPRGAPELVVATLVCPMSSPELVEAVVLRVIVAVVAVSVDSRSKLTYSDVDTGMLKLTCTSISPCACPGCTVLVVSMACERTPRAKGPSDPSAPDCCSVPQTANKHHKNAVCNCVTVLLLLNILL